MKQVHESKVATAQLQTSRARSSAAKLFLAAAEAVPIGAISTSNFDALPPALFSSLTLFKHDLSKLGETMGGQKPSQDTPAWAVSTAVLAAGRGFWQERIAELETRLATMVREATKACKSAVPDWRPYTLAKPDEAMIKKNLIDGSLVSKLASVYTPCAALMKDIEAYDDAVELHFRLKHKEPWESFTDAVAEVKLVMGVQHGVNVIYVTGPAANGPKAKAGLIREFKRRIKAADIKNMPAELVAQVNAI